MSGDFFPPVRVCILCGGDQLHRSHQVYYWREYPLTYDECAGCGAFFANPMPTDSVIAKGNNALVRLYQQNRGLDQEFREGRQAYLRGKMLAQRLRKIKPRGRFLELGSYHGFVSLGVKENCDWEVECLEISTDLCAFMSQTLGLKTHCGTLESLSLPPRSYDFVICHDLIEHINQPIEFLKRVEKLLAPHGSVEILTPNADQDLQFTRRASREGHPITMLLNHVLLFRKRTLRLALERAGLSVHELYSYDVRHALKDYGVLGLGEKITPVGERPSIAEALLLPEHQTLSFWNPTELKRLREHPRVRLAYGWWKESLPRALRVRVPESIEWGHEIYARASVTGE